MKLSRTIYFVLLVITGYTCFSQALLQPGDNLTDYLKKNPAKVKIGEQSLFPIPEGKYTFYGYSEKIDGTTPIIVYCDEKYPVGVLQGMSPRAYYIFDLDGDGIVESPTSTAILPYWVVYQTSKKRTRKDTISEVMTAIYDAFQSDQGPANNESMNNAIRTMDQYTHNNKNANRDLMYLLYFYSEHNQRFMEISLKALDLLESESKKRFKKVHPLIYLYYAETNLNLGNVEKAREYIAILREMDETFIPAIAYDLMLEPDKEKAQQIKEKLKKEHGSHWIVKQL